MTYLLDTNVIVEFLLNQEKAEEAEQFLQGIPPDEMYFTDFAFHSVGVILINRKMHDVFEETADDLFLAGGIQILHLGLGDIKSVVQAAQKFTLDFDDAYQYVAAEKHDLTIVSFDAHFDRTERGRKTPGQALEEYVQKEEDE